MLFECLINHVAIQKEPLHFRDMVIIKFIFAAIIILKPFSCLTYKDGWEDTGHPNVPGFGSFLDRNHINNYLLCFSHVSINLANLLWQIHSFLLFLVCLFVQFLIFLCFFFRDVKAPLSQIRVSLVSSLGAGQIIFLTGIGATKNKVILES